MARRADENETVELTIDLLGAAGDGIGHLRDGEVEIPWDETRYSLRLIGPDTGQTHQATPPLVSLPGPGQYEVHFGSFAGYRPVAPQPP